MRDKILNALKKYYQPKSRYPEFCLSRGAIPKYKILLKLFRNDGIPMESWENIHDYIASQEKEKEGKADCEDDTEKSDINCEKNNSQAS